MMAALNITSENSNPNILLQLGKNLEWARLSIFMLHP
jgi:hypothetical protein